MIETLALLGMGAVFFAAGMGCMWLIARDYGRTMQKFMGDAHDRLMSTTWTDYMGMRMQEADQPTSDPLRTRRSDAIEARIAREGRSDGENA